MKLPAALLHSAALGLVIALTSHPSLPAQARFVRGDVNLDGQSTLADVTAYFQFRYLGGPAPACMDAADTDDSGALDTAMSADAFFLFDWLLRRTGAPALLPPPFPAAGVDPTADGLPCADGTIEPPAPRRGNELHWKLPERIVRGTRRVRATLEVTTRDPIDSLGVAYRINKAVLADVSVDFDGTIFPPPLQDDYEASPAFGYAVVPSADSSYDLLLVGAVFIGLPPLGGFNRIPFPLTSGPVSNAPILRLSARVLPDAPLGPQQLLLPAEDEDFVGANRITHGLKNELGGQDGASDLPIAAVPDTSIMVDAPEFLRGNANQDNQVDLSDAVHSLSFLFGGGPAPACPDAADANDSGEIDVSDAVFTLNFLFQGTVVLPSPGPTDCGGDESEDDLPCCLPSFACPDEFGINICEK